jgi:two-component system response regulator ResD
MNIKVLVADDDPILRELVCDILKKEGLIPIEASDGDQALKLFFGANDIALVILDVMMPVYNGWEVLKEIREHSEVSVIMLTALGDEGHEVLGLKRGADDYITKPFSYEVFVARINSLLRKLKKNYESTHTAGKIRINQATHRMIIADRELELNRKEYYLLLYFVENENKILSREQILNHVWGYDFDGEIRTVDTHIKTLRAKLGACSRYIKTVHGLGYLFEVIEP